MANFYDVLHVSRDAPRSLIRASYNLLSKDYKVNPHIPSEKPAALRRIETAFEVLYDPDRRKKYDDLLLKQEKVAPITVATKAPSETKSAPLAATEPRPTNVEKPRSSTQRKSATQQTTTILRLLGGGILLFNLWLIGHYDLSGIPVLLLTFGFAIGYEYWVVRPAARKKPEALP